MRKKIFLILGGLFFFLFNHRSLLANAFETNYDVYYSAGVDGKIKVTQNISIVNKLANVYASQYSLSLKDISIENVRVEDIAGPLKTEILKTDQTVTISIYFREQAVGVGQKQNFKIAYEAVNLAKKKGQIWEVDIPRLAKENQIDAYNLTLEVPDEFGVLSSIKPNPIETKRQTNSTLYKFSQEQLATAAINASFGQYQIFDFKFNYAVENSNTASDFYQIALPPDTLYQKVFYKNINPQPANVEVDQDGNWLAIYKLKPQEKLVVKAQGKVRLFSEPQSNSFFNSQNNFQNYLSPAKYWETDDPNIKKIAQELKTPRKIYDYVLKTLNYDYKRIGEGAERLGAAGVLQSPNQALCMEFTDLFIALARAANIPAREINGYAYTTNNKIQSLEPTIDILHSWPEYYDYAKETWVPVDPTWGETTEGIDYFSKMDVYHFAFIIHGKDSVLPYPVGSYKFKNQTEKNIEISFGEYEKEDSPTINVQFNLPERILFAKKYQGKITLNNQSPFAIYDTEVKIRAEGINFVGKKEVFAVLPPFSYKEIPIDIKSSNFFNYSQARILVEVLKKTDVYTLQIGSLMWQIIVPLIVVIALIIIFILTKRSFFGRK